MSRFLYLRTCGSEPPLRFKNEPLENYPGPAILVYLMGLTPTTIFHPGDPCDPCFGIGKPFYPSPSPICVRIAFSGVLNCSDGLVAAMNGFYALRQGPVNPCEYAFRFGAQGAIVYQFAETLFIASFSYRDEDGNRWFSSKQPACELGGANSFGMGDCSPTTLGYDGFASVAWGPGIVC